MAEPDAQSGDFELLPADDPGSTPEQDLEAAIASALSPDYVSLVGEGPVPIGYTWLFDYEAGRHVMRGQAPVRATGIDNIKTWALGVTRTARWAHGVFSDAFGMEEPDAMVGLANPRPALRAYEDALRRALLVHDRITDLVDFEADWDPASGIVTISNFTVTLDDEARLSLGGPITIRPEGS